MRHRCRVRKLGLPADQRKALIRTLVTSLFQYGEIVTTLVRAKALVPEASKIVTLAKRGDVHAIRQVARKVYHVKTGAILEPEGQKPLPETVLRRIFRTYGPRFQARQGGYIRIIPAPPRRGDNAKMALVQLLAE